MDRLRNAGIRVSMFIDPDRVQIEASMASGAEAIELHTGAYAACVDQNAEKSEYSRITGASHLAADLGLKVNAGHGLHYQNVSRIAAVPEISELNIGHSIIAESVFVGLHKAVRTMKDLILDSAMGRL